MAMRWPISSNGRQNKKKILFGIAVFFFLIYIFKIQVINSIPTKRDRELYNLIDIVFSIENITIVNKTGLGILHRNVKPLPELNQTRLEQIYSEKYQFLQDKSDLRPNEPCINLPSVPNQHVHVYQEYAPLPMLEALGFHLEHGGTFKPKCKSTQRTAIIIPFRNRDIHLSVWLLHLHPFLQRQNIDYTVFIVNQVVNTTFNKGVLMNSGFMEISKLDRFDCFIFHDVDLLPEDERTVYTCDSSGIKHLAYALEEWNYKLLYSSLVGGVVAVTWQDYLRLNGFSNQFFGWGGEDDDFYVRISQNNLDIIRYPLSISRYTMVQHHRDKGNDVNVERYKLLRQAMTTNMNRRDGLNNLAYKLESVEKLPLFTRLNISFDVEKVKNAQPHALEYPYLKEKVDMSSSS